MPAEEIETSGGIHEILFSTTDASRKAFKYAKAVPGRLGMYCQTIHDQTRPFV